MIHCTDKGDLFIEGDSALLANQLAAIIVNVTNAINDKSSDRTIEHTMDSIMELVNIKRLTDKGMSLKEAVEVLGLQDKIIIR